MHLLCGCVGVFGAEPTCQRLEYRDYYEDPATKCRTRVRVKHRRCQGSCGGTATGFCCLPRKIKTRRASVDYSLYVLLRSILTFAVLIPLNVGTQNMHFKVSLCQLVVISQRQRIARKKFYLLTYLLQSFPVHFSVHQRDGLR